MAISTRLAAARRNTLTACLCAAIGAAAGSASATNTPSDAPNAKMNASRSDRAPLGPFSSIALPAAAPSAHATSGNAVLVSSCADDGSSGTLRSAIQAAADGDTIDLSGLACSTITLEQGLLVVTVANLTLKGPGADSLTIDGNNGGAVITGSNLDIQGMTLAHGVNLSGFAGCVLTTSDLSLSDVHVSACIAASGTLGAAGGGMVVLGDLTMRHSTISSSKASGAGNTSGGGAAVGGTATLYDSVISDSSVETSQGYVYGGGLIANGAITLHASTIDRNTAYSPSSVAYGGGLHSSYSDISVLEGSAVTNNSASSYFTWSYGGGINSGTIAHAGPATVTVSRSTISGNTVDSHCSSCFVTGGGVQAVDSIVVEYSTINENEALCDAASSGCSAGGGGLSSVARQATSSVSLRNATISTNQAIGGTMVPAIGFAGGVVVESGAPLIAHNSTIAFNHASTSGAGFAAGSPPDPPSKLISTIVANNDTDAGPDDIGVIPFANSLTIDGSNNIVVAAGGNVTLPNDTNNADPHLLPLTTADGGTTAVHPLASDSAAIDGGANPDSLGCDQRGVPYRRKYGANADIGAYEYQGEPHIFTDGFDGPNPACLFAP